MKKKIPNLKDRLVAEQFRGSLAADQHINRNRQTLARISKTDR
jgi:hypothetical protein